MFVKTIRLTTLATLLSFLPLQAYANDRAVIYRWLDENNVAHFSQIPPAHVELSEVYVEVAYSPPPKKVEAEQEDDLPNNLSKEKKIKNCQSAQENIKILSDFKNISFKDDMGKKRLLTEEEKVEHLENSQKIVKMYCEK